MTLDENDLEVAFKKGWNESQERFDGREQEEYNDGYGDDLAMNEAFNKWLEEFI